MAEDTKPWELYNAAPTEGGAKKPWETYATKEDKEPWELYTTTEKPKRKSEDVGYFEGLAGAAKRGIESVADVGSGLSLAGSAAVGADESAREKMAAIKEEAKKEAETPATSFADLERIYEEKGLLSALGQVPKYTTEQVISSAPQMAIPLAAGAAASPFLTPIGGMLVGMGVYGVQQFGNFIMRQAQEKESPADLELSKAALAAGATAPLGYLVDRWTAGLGGLGPKKAGAEIAKELTARQAAAAAGKRVLTGAAEGIIAEAPLEVLEQAAERWQAGLDLTGDDAYKEYKEAFFGAAAAGAAIKGTTKGLGIGEGQPQQAPGPQIESAEGTPLPVQPLDTAQKEVAAEAAGKPPIGATVNEQEIAKLAATIEADLGVPYESAELIAREQLNAGRDTTGANNAVVTGSAQPGVSLPNDGGAAPTGLVPPNLSGLAGPSGLTGEPNGGAGQQPSTLTTPPIPAPTTFKELIPAEKAAVVDKAKQLWDNSAVSAGVPNWNSLPNWKRELFAEEVQAGNVDFQSDNRLETVKAVADTKSKKTAQEVTESVTKQEEAPPITPPITPDTEAVTTPQNTTVAPTPIPETNAPTEVVETNAPTEVTETNAPAEQALTEEPIAASVTLQNPVVGKKVGRRALPPEQKAASDLKRAGRRGEIKGVNKQVSNAAALLDTPLDVSGIDTEQGIKTAEQDHINARRQALEDLYSISVDPANRGLGASKAATERLNKEDITPAERALAKERYEFKKKTQRSAASEVTKPYTADDLVNEINEFVGSEANPVKLTVVQSWDQLPEKVREKAERDGGVSTDKGFVQSNRAYLIADNIQEGTGRAVFMHEVGSHIGLQGLLPSVLLNKLGKQIQAWAQKNDGSVESKLAQQALDKVRDVNVPLDQQITEQIAYFIEIATNEGLVPTALKSKSEFGNFIRQIFQLFRIAVRKLGLAANRLNAQDIVDLAYGAARLEMAGKWHGTAAEFRNFNHAFMNSGEGAQAFGWGSYLAQRKGIGHTYWEQDVDRKTTTDLDLGTADIDALITKYGSWNFLQAKNLLLDSKGDYSQAYEELVRSFGHTGSDIQAALGAMEEAGAKVTGTAPEGQLKRVDFAIANDEWLDWDKPLDQQSKKVQDAYVGLDGNLIDHMAEYYERNNIDSPTGEDFYRALKKAVEYDYIPDFGNAEFEAALAQGQYDKAASLFLDHLGVKGLKFLDRPSRQDARVQKKIGRVEERIKEYQKLLDTAQEAIDEAVARQPKQYQLESPAHAALFNKYKEEDINLNIQQREKFADYIQQYKDEIADLKKQQSGQIPTQNAVVFDDKNIISVASRKGAKQERTQFSRGAKAPQTNNVADHKYNTFTSVQQAIKYVAKIGTPFEKAMANRLAPFLKDVRFIVAQAEKDVPTIRLENGETLQQAFKDASGIYATAVGADGKRFKYIVLRGENFGDPSMQGINNTIFLHEGLHAATAAKVDEYYSLQKEGKPIPADLQMLMNTMYDIMQAAKDAYDFKVGEAKLLGEKLPATLRHKFESKANKGLDITEDVKEFIAYGLTDEAVQQLLLSADGVVSKAKHGAVAPLKTLFSKFVDSLRKAFGMSADHKSALQELMLVTEGLMQQQELSPAELSAVNKAQTANARLDKDMEAIKLSNDAHGVTNSLGNAIRNKDFGAFKDLYEASLPAMGNSFITKTLKTLQSSDIIRWVGDKIPALKRLDAAAQHMAGMRSLMMQASAKKADQLGKFIRKNKGGMQALADTMHLARLQNQDPVTTTVPELKAAWDKLGTIPGGHDMYKMVEKFYKDNYALVRHLLDQRIDSMGLDEESKKGLMLQIRKMQEEEKQGVYFPFMREGKFWLRIDGPNGKEFYMFEGGTQRNLFEIQRAKQLGLDIKDAREAGTFMSGDNFASFRKNAPTDSKMLTEMFDAIDKATAKPGMDKEALKDQLYQTYLMTLPEQSIRKQFLHAENVTGFSADIFRNFKTSAMRLANQASKLKYGTEIQAAVQQGKDSLEGNPDRAKLGLFIDELSERANAELDPPEQSWLATKLNQIAYYWLLTGAASAATQLASIPIMVMPSLNTEYGYAKSAKMFSKYALSKSLGVTREDANGNVTYHAPSIGDSQMVKKSPLLQKAFKEFVARGVTTDTNVSVLTNRNRTPANAYDSQPGAFLRSTANVMSSLFNGAERLSREATAMMTFELEYAKTKDFDASVQKAIDTTQELLGRYDNFNRPTVMRGFIGKTLGQFKMYAVNMTSFFLRNAYNMHKVLFKGQRQEGLDAMHRLTGVLAMGGMFHGLVGMPGYSVITSAIDAVLNSFGDEEEKRKRRARNPFTSDNSDLRFRYEFLPKMFGDVKITGLDGRQHTLAKVLEKGAISELTDMNIGSRTSFDGMWYRGAKPGKDTIETINNTILANLGPGVSTLTNMAGSVDDFHNGHILRGLEKLVPAFFKNPITATRIAQEGVTTKRGDAMLKKSEVGADTVVAQALGFQSTRVARLQEEGFAIQKEVITADRARKELLTHLDEALLSSDSTFKDKQKIINQIVQHNKRYPAEGFFIDMDTIDRSLDRAIANKGLTIRGQQIKENLLPYLYKLRQAASPTK